MTIGINPNGLGFIDEVREMGDATPDSQKASGYDASYSMRYREFNVYTYSMNVNNGIKYNLGARDLLEYITHKIEAKHFISIEKLSQLPYESVDLLLRIMVYPMCQKILDFVLRRFVCIMIILYDFSSQIY